jgi:hypothetical protein
MTIKQFYLENYPSDDLGTEIDEGATFAGLLNNIITTNDVYSYIGVGDSIIRERLFSKLAEQLNTSYDYVYNLWLKK